MWNPFRFGKSRASEFGVEKFLASIVRRGDLAQLVRTTPDRRQLFELAARSLGFNEEDLLREFGSRARLPIVVHPLPADVRFVALVLGGLTIADFRRAGAIPITGSEHITGVICVDPVLFHLMLPSLVNIPVHLSTWGAIVEALDLSERQFRDQEQREAQDRRARLERAARTVFTSIVKEAGNASATSVELAFSSEQCTYRFATGDGKNARGSFHSMVHDQLVELCERGCREGSTFLAALLEERVVGVPTSIERVVPRARYIVRLEVPVVAAKEKPLGQLVPFPPSNSSRILVTGEPDLRVRVVRSESEASMQSAVPPAGESAVLPEAAIIRAKTERSVLVVDDNPTFGKVLERFFSRHHVTTTVVEDGAAGLAILEGRGQIPDAIICDVHMPTMNGVEFLQRVRAMERFRNIPMVMLTSDGDIEVQIGLLSKGADAFVRKSDDPRLLWVHVQRLIEREQRAA